jgi:hypothetical protein
MAAYGDLAYFCRLFVAARLCGKFVFGSWPGSRGICVAYANV